MTNPAAVRSAWGKSLQVMREACREALRTKGICPFGQRLRPKRFSSQSAGQLLGGTLLNDVILYALSVAQYNAGLGRIVACPLREAVGGTWCSAPHLGRAWLQR